MSAPAQVTEAHFTLRRDVIYSAPDEGAQLIAESEAKATAELLKEVANLKYANHYHRKTAETSRATETDRNNLRADLDAIKAILTEEKGRAGRAEAELAGIRALADRRNERDHSQDTTHQLVAALDQALDIAQAELAQFRELDAERARMRQIAVDKRIRTHTPRTDEARRIDNGDTHPLLDEMETMERELATERARLDWLESSAATELQSERGWIDRAVIDAGMKEGGK